MHRLLLGQPGIFSHDHHPLDVLHRHEMMFDPVMVEPDHHLTGKLHALATMQQTFLFGAGACRAVADQFHLIPASLAPRLRRIPDVRPATATIQSTICEQFMFFHWFTSLDGIHYDGMALFCNMQTSKGHIAAAPVSIRREIKINLILNIY